MIADSISPVESPSDEKLQDLEDCVRRKLASYVRQFRLSFRDNGLVLEGRTRSFYAKQVAQHAVMSAIDLHIGANRIQVDER